MLQGRLDAASQGSRAWQGLPRIPRRADLASVPSASVGFAAFFVQMEGKLFPLPPSPRLLVPRGLAWLEVLPGGFHTYLEHGTELKAELK